jgi:hypothetical protein
VALALSSVNADNDDKFHTNDDKICEWVEMQGHTDCPSTLYELIYVDKSVTTTTHQLTSLDSPGPSQEEQETTRDNMLLPTTPSRKDALMALLVLDSVISLSNPDDTSVKAMDELQDVCLKYIKIT